MKERENSREDKSPHLEVDFSTPSMAPTPMNRKREGWRHHTNIASRDRLRKSMINSKAANDLLEPDLSEEKAKKKDFTIAAERSDSEETEKKLYDFSILTKHNLGSIFSKNHSNVTKNSNIVSSTEATTGKGGKVVEARPSIRAKKERSSGSSLVFKPKTMIPTSSSRLGSPSPADNFAQPKFVLADSNQVQSSFIVSGGSEQNPAGKVDAYANFFHKLNFTSLLEAGDMVVSKHPKTIIEDGVSRTIVCLIWKSGSVYEGEILDKKFEGFGTLNHHSGYTIKGCFHRGKLQGQGEFNKGKQYYKGDWLENKPHGRGLERYEGVYEYRGEFVNGHKTGKGRMKIVGKGTYEGDFRLNYFHGVGVFQWDNGKVYTGQWANNYMHGKGKMVWPDGRKYEGRYEKGKKDGQGQFIWADGKVFSGTWKNGKQQGAGKYTSLMGDKREASWVQGACHFEDYR